MRTLLSTVSFALLASIAAVPAQVCQGAQVLLKNDNLPAVPPPVPTSVAVIPGLCQGEGCAAVFDVSAIGTRVRVNSAAIGFFNQLGTPGIAAAVDLEFFDGISWSGGVPTLGPSVFRLSSTGSNLQISSGSINTSPSLTAQDIVVTSGTLVVAWWMVQNLGAGSCMQGYSTNFSTDADTSILGTCSAGTRKNLIFIEGQGWRDTATARAGTPPLVLPICPLFYNGNWIVRACVERAPGSCPAPVALGSGTAGTGGLVPALATNGEARLGSMTFGLDISNGRGGAPGLTLIGVTPVTVPFAGGTIQLLPLVSLPFVLTGAPGAAGTGTAMQTLPIPGGAGAVGLPLLFQSAVVDPAAVTQIALTHGLQVILCR